MWVIGIDGGGTKCKAGLFDKKGRLLGTSVTGPANIFSDFDTALVEIEKACDLLLKNAQTDLGINIQKSDCIVSAGCAGASISSAQMRFLEWQHPFLKLILSTDIHIAALGAAQGEDCFLAIVGTGSCFALYENQQIRQFGGHGFLLGDFASGAWLGKMAVTWFLQALEGHINDAALHDVLSRELGIDAQLIIEKFGQGQGRDFAQLLPCLLLVQEQSIELQKWLQQGLEYIYKMSVLHNSNNLPIYMMGGLKSLYLNELNKAKNKKMKAALNMSDLQLEPVHGAYLYARSCQEQLS